MAHFLGALEFYLWLPEVRLSTLEQIATALSLETSRSSQAHEPVVAFGREQVCLEVGHASG